VASKDGSSAGFPAPESVVARKSFTTPQGRKVEIITSLEMDPKDKPEKFGAMIEAVAVLGDDFGGTARKAAKLSIAEAEIEEFDDLQDLLASLVPDAKMKKHQPQISILEDSDRVAEEERNVLVHTFLYAASREADNDFHLILGRDPSLSPPRFMTMEISGLPPEGSPFFEALKAARDAYKAQKAHFGNSLPGFRYDFYKPPIPIDVTGSLFFDMSHATGPKPGPPSAKPGQIWEIHPITEIVFEP